MTHTSKQLQYIGFGTAASWYLGSFRHLQIIWVQGYSLPGILARATLICTCLTTSLFLYILVYLPRIRGVYPDYEHWRSNELKPIVPALTISIITGWNILVYILSYYSSLGLIRSIIAGLGLYALSFGIVGMIPSPLRRKSEVPSDVPR
ncbi:hypothetical protein BS47DRAFT_306218 [Hydnum rufescens UP504]|uniref:Uncharacterized protein n=1 Tax=Hydnum rufescens UP504 TaxID=1448309 RepID=A0A9P6AKI4_9AGAM|nr:hypothetical protein BS47DRAFT_306218 [Hydnum rufescens UP504]